MRWNCQPFDGCCSRKLFAFTAEAQGTQRKAILFVRRYRQTKYTRAPLERFFAEGQRLIKNRHLPILHKKNILLSDLRVSNESYSYRTNGRWNFLFNLAQALCLSKGSPPNRRVIPLRPPRLSGESSSILTPLPFFDKVVFQEHLGWMLRKTMILTEEPFLILRV